MSLQVLDDKKTLYLPCFCGDSNHLLTFTYDIFNESDDESDANDMLVFINMNHYLSWWPRLILGLKYIFGKKPSNCHFQDTYINEQKIYELKEFLDIYLNTHLKE